MAWVKIDDQAPRNAKMLAAGPAACWLWVCGIAHCQSQLTDGFISLDVLPMIGIKGEARCRRLADTLVNVGLFERAEGGYQVHGYLDHNPSRVQVMAKRAEDAERKRSGEERRTEDRRTPRGIQTESRAPRAGVPSHPIPSEPKPEREKPSLSPPADPFVNDEITMRAGNFVRRYREDLFPKYRNGARYLGHERRDYDAAVAMCETWPDDRLDKLAIIWLTTNHKFAEEGSRTLPQMRAVASWLDGKLTEHEARKAAAI